jgi:ribonuclease HI
MSYKKRCIYVTTDGAVSNNGDINGTGLIFGGIGAIFSNSPNGESFGEFNMGYADRPEEVTNNRMELLAVIEGLNYLKDQYGASIFREIIVQSDSQYVIKGITEWVINWKRNNWRTAGGKDVKNIDLWKKLITTTKLFTKEIEWKHVKGHNGHMLQEKADKLATDSVASEKNK